MSEPTQSTARDYEMGLEACAALARATWFAEYLERKFAAVRAAERERCAAIVDRYPDEANPAAFHEESVRDCCEVMVARIRSGEL